MQQDILLERAELIACAMLREARRKKKQGSEGAGLLGKNNKNDRPFLDDLSAWMNV